MCGSVFDWIAGDCSPVKLAHKSGDESNTDGLKSVPELLKG